MSSMRMEIKDGYINLWSGRLMQSVVLKAIIDDLTKSNDFINKRVRYIYHASKG